MILTSLSLLNYKNFESISFDFDDKINCLVGDNGVGKTNVLDAIYQLSFGKSYFNPVTTQNIRHGADFFVIDGHYTQGQQTERVIVSYKRNQKKIIKRNGKEYEKISEHIGHIPLVMISPADRDLITEGSETRRRFMDGVICQSDKQYLQHLIAYNKVLAQRNALLKYFAANHTFQADTLQIYNTQLQQYGTLIYEKRKQFVEEFIPIFSQRHQSVSQGKETVRLVYKSDLEEETLDRLLEKSLAKDRAFQYTTAGIHKDDLFFEIDTYPIKKFGSQGQQKSYLIALKLAQFDFLKSLSKVNPVLLLDDVFDKLDENRVAQIIALVKNDNFGQLFISDTHPERTENVVRKVHQSYKIFNLSAENKS
jgi:DNA replication and repair protein RecF